MTISHLKYSNSAYYRTSMLHTPSYKLIVVYNKYETTNFN